MFEACDLLIGALFIAAGLVCWGAWKLGERNAEQLGFSKWDVENMRGAILCRIVWLPVTAYGIVCVMRHAVG